MLLLSRIVGTEVSGLDGTAFGRITDMAITLDCADDAAVVDRVLVCSKRRVNLAFEWIAIAHCGIDGIRVRSRGVPVASTAEFSGSRELLLCRDVLDTRIVDVIGQRLARVADVVLRRRPDGRLVVVAVEVGFGAVLRRLGLTRMAARSNTDAVAWTDLHLTSARGHVAQLNTPRSAVHRLDSRALAGLVSRLNVSAAADVLTTRGPNATADVVDSIGHDLGEHILRAMADDEAAEVVAAMPAEQASRWSRILARRRLLRGRPLLRSHLWPRRRPEP